jgi:hypothetical protein
MKGRTLRTVTTMKETRRRWSHPEPADMRKLLEGGLEPRSADGLRRHLRCCLRCTLLAGKVAAAEGSGVEVFE